MRIKNKVVPAALVAALSSPLAYTTLERWEGNILSVYADNLADGLPTYCAGRTNKNAVIGTKLTSDQCKEINKLTLVEYGYAVLGCTNWDMLDADRLVALTIFAINVGKSGACGSQAIQSVNAGQVSKGCELLARKPNGDPNWSNASGKYVPGLQNRRQAERKLCRKGLPS